MRPQISDPRQNSFLLLRHLEIQLQINSGSPDWCGDTLGPLRKTATFPGVSGCRDAGASTYPGGPFLRSRCREISMWQSRTEPHPLVTVRSEAQVSRLADDPLTQCYSLPGRRDAGLRYYDRKVNDGLEPYPEETVYRHENNCGRRGCRAPWILGQPTHIRYMNFGAWN